MKSQMQFTENAVWGFWVLTLTFSVLVQFSVLFLKDSFQVYLQDVLLCPVA